MVPGTKFSAATPRLGAKIALILSKAGQKAPAVPKIAVAASTPFLRLKLLTTQKGMGSFR
jgi:hypothetical protein